MAIAIISDIHANLEALLAVLGDITDVKERFGITEIHCLGDIVNYGPDPKECIDLVREQCDVVLRGNHDEAVGTKNDRLLETFNDAPQAGVAWTRGRLKEEDFRYLAGLPHRHIMNGLAETHGTLCSKPAEYDIDYTCDSGKNLEFAHFTLYSNTHRPGDGINVARCFASMRDFGSKVCAVGHVQIAECYLQRIGRAEIKRVPMLARNKGKVSVSLKLDNQHRYLIDVGAVGQPRDFDNRASYGIYAGDRFIIRRVPYDFEATIQKILKTPLSQRFAYRLRTGE